MRPAIRIIVICLLAAATGAAQQMKDCNPQSGPAYTIFLDEVRVVDQNATEAVSNLRNALYSSMRNHLDAIAIEREDEPSLGTVECSGRFPTPQQFERDRVEWLNDHKVVMEVWGDLRGVGQANYNADLNVSVIPARAVELTTSKPPSYFRIEQTIPSGATPERVLSLFREYRELSGYAFIAAGLRALSDGADSYDYANAYLCRGASSLRGTTNPKQQQLLRYVDKVSDDLVKRAQNDPRYTGTLKLLSLANAKGRCP